MAGSSGGVQVVTAEGVKEEIAELTAVSDEDDSNRRAERQLLTEVLRPGPCGIPIRRRCGGINPGVKRLAVVSVAGLLAIFAAWSLASGLDLWGRALGIWGTRDSPPGVYLAVGGGYVLVALGILVMLARRRRAG